LTGSERPELGGAEDQGRADPNQAADVTLYLRGKMSDAEIEQFVEGLSAKPVSERHYLSREELGELRGATPEDIARVEAFANRYHLKVTSADAAARTVAITGTVANLESAFGVELRNCQSDGAAFRDYSGSISIPAEIAPIVVGVLGLNTRPIARPRGA
jgi:kumamolisin